MAFLKQKWFPEQRQSIFKFFCPGCLTQHFVLITSPDKTQPVYKWNGCHAMPSFDKIIEITEPKKCRFWISNGFFLYQDDCDHELKGQQIKMVEYKDEPLNPQ